MGKRSRTRSPHAARRIARRRRQGSLTASVSRSCSRAASPSIHTSPHPIVITRSPPDLAVEVVDDVAPVRQVDDVGVPGEASGTPSTTSLPVTPGIGAWAAPYTSVTITRSAPATLAPSSRQNACTREYRCGWTKAISRAGATSPRRLDRHRHLGAGCDRSRRRSQPRARDPRSSNRRCTPVNAGRRPRPPRRGVDPDEPATRDRRGRVQQVVRRRRPAGAGSASLARPRCADPPRAPPGPSSSTVSRRSLSGSDPVGERRRCPRSVSTDRDPRVVAARDDVLAPRRELGERRLDLLDAPPGRSPRGPPRRS